MGALNLIGGICWYAMLLAPVIGLFIIWRKKSLPRLEKGLFVLFFTVCTVIISLLFFSVSVAIVA
jgi:hypothetical protein